MSQETVTIEQLAAENALLKKQVKALGNFVFGMHLSHGRNLTQLEHSIDVTYRQNDKKKEGYGDRITATEYFADCWAIFNKSLEQH